MSEKHKQEKKKYGNQLFNFFIRMSGKEGFFKYFKIYYYLGKNCQLKICQKILNEIPKLQYYIYQIFLLLAVLVA